MHARPLALCVLVSCCALLAGERSIAATTDVAEGRGIAREYCAKCHATDRGRRRPDAAAPPFREILAIYPIQDLANAINEGDLPTHKGVALFELSAERLGALLTYIYSLAPLQPDSGVFGVNMYYGVPPYPTQEERVFAPLRSRHRQQAR